MSTGVALSTGPVENPDELALVADEWTPLGKRDADRFREACRLVAMEHDGYVDPSDVRERLLKNGELDIAPRRYSALWSAAAKKDGGFLTIVRGHRVPIRGEGSRGNTNKSLPLRRWVGDPFHDDRQEKKP